MSFTEPSRQLTVDYETYIKQTQDKIDELLAKVDRLSAELEAARGANTVLANQLHAAIAQIQIMQYEDYEVIFTSDMDLH